jgi:hypothetical protein
MKVGRVSAEIKHGKVLHGQTIAREFDQDLDLRTRNQAKPLHVLDAQAETIAIGPLQKLGSEGDEAHL